MIVTAVAWTSVSRSGHWTFFSSAQQEARKPMTPPRWRSACACFCFLASCSRSRRFCSSRLRFSASLRAFASARRSARRGLRRVGGLELRSRGRRRRSRPRPPRSRRSSPETGTWVSCWARDSALALAAGALALLSFPSPALGLALCAGLGHRRLPGLLVRRCGGRTSGRTCASRSGPASFAGTCWSGSCAACTLRKPASPRCGHLREPFLLVPLDAVTKENPGPRREAERRIAGRRGH